MPDNVSGNAITALRLADIFQQLGYAVKIDHKYRSEPSDLLVALHALRSYPAIAQFHSHYPDRPIIVILTGTDIYHYIKTHNDARHSLQLAARLVALQKLAVQELPAQFQHKATVIYQSAAPLAIKASDPGAGFRVSVISNLREVKDPLRAALAARDLPAASRLKIVHVGAPLEAHLEQQAQAETAHNPRYRWLGELPHQQTLEILAGSHLLAITSQIEGGSNVLCEALAARVPIISSKISGIIGTLGEDYPGYFPVGDTHALRDLLWECESNAQFYATLKSRCDQLSHLVDPAHERAAWQQLLSSLLV